jgi:carbonic anhydrase
MNQNISRRRLLQSAAVAGVGLSLTWFPGRGKIAHAQGAATADQALEIIRKGNQRYVRGNMNMRDFNADRKALASGQSPHTAILACADSRVAPELAFDQARGQLFVVRVAGNFVNEDGLASLEYTTKILGTPLIMVLGHTQCGAVAATIDVVKKNAQLPGHLPTLVRAIKPAIDKARGEHGDMLLNTIKANVLFNVNKLKTAAPIISQLVDQGKVKVVGGVYHLKTGEVELLG